MGLNESFSIIRGKILVMDPLPPMSNVFALVVQDESQREIHQSPILDSVVTLTAKQNFNSGGQNKQTNRGSKPTSNRKEKNDM